MKGAGVDNGGPVRSLCVCPSFNTAPDGNNNKYMCQKGESDRAKGMLGEKRPPCVLTAVHMRAV